MSEDSKGWLGTSFNNIINHKVLMHTQPLCFNKGINRFTISQIMRENPLENVLSAGIILKKINNQ